MGSDYRFTIVRKADKKPIATFYFNKVKNVNDIYCKGLAVDFSHISGDDKQPTVIQVNDLEGDKHILETKLSFLRQQVFEKKLLSAAAKNVEVKHDFEQDILDIEAEIDDYKWAWSAYDSLLAVVTCLVEDLVVSSDDDKDHLAYVKNAEDLDGKDSVWVNDVELQAVCFW